MNNIECIKGYIKECYQSCLRYFTFLIGTLLAIFYKVLFAIFIVAITISTMMFFIISIPYHTYRFLVVLGYVIYKLTLDINHTFYGRFLNGVWAVLPISFISIFIESGEANIITFVNNNNPKENEDIMPK